MTWILAVARAAQKQLRRIPVRDRDKIAAAIRTMATDPFEGDIIKLEGEADRYRRRVGNLAALEVPGDPQRGQHLRRRQAPHHVAFPVDPLEAGVAVEIAPQNRAPRPSLP